MKKLFLIILFGFSISTFAQKVRGDKVEIENYIAKKWDVEYALMSGLVIKKLPLKTDFEISLTKNGTFQINKLSGEVIKGTWVYNSLKHYIILLSNENIIGKIAKLESNKMELIFISDKDSNSNLADIKAILKPF
ncbi:hypothetical protein R3X25_01725 [Lutibacter sp. TH_r2]|uniref:hypothetical protein n=1 Tax=Lutibacter sp. TH_r2 TaxID=3082083 RepID=UPI0029556A9B|nr:hypothetical protein [Lutibacter sp. TH_r2]MDV7185985.1 hypothetical protein [Lutibacter sp. TH_r2]